MSPRMTVAQIFRLDLDRSSVPSRFRASDGKKELYLHSHGAASTLNSLV